MAENEKIYDIIILNNASKETFLYQGVEDVSDSYLYHEFDIELDVPEGEYTYVVLKNTRDDVEYDFKTPILDSLVLVDDEKYLLRDFQPGTGLLRIGENIDPVNIYDKESENNNQQIFYYDE